MQFYDRQCNLLNDNICLSIYTYNTCYADMTFINIKAQHSDSTHDALISHTSELGQEVEGGVYELCVNGLTCATQQTNTLPLLYHDICQKT